MRGTGFWMVVALVAGVMIMGILQSPDAPPEGPPPAAGAPPAPERPTVAYALDTARTNWPPLEGAPPAEPAKNLEAVNYYIVLDGSGSMRKTQCSGNRSKIEAAIAAVTAFTQSVRDDQNMGLAVFDANGVSERVPLADHNRVAMATAVAAVRADGGTPLRSAIELGFERLTQQARRQHGYGEYHLVVVTDGHPEPPSEDPTGIVNRLLLESPVQLHTVGFCLGENHVLNQPGRVFYAAAENPEQLRQGLESVLAESQTFDVSKFQ
jgi:Ca-activated chloride channel family protein